MAKASAYPSYRASGLPWAPRLPERWQVLRNGRLFGHRVETGFPDLPILEVSLRTGVRVRDMENLKRKQVMSEKEKYKRAVQGDIAYNMMRMWQGACGLADRDAMVSPAYVVLQPKPTVEPIFAYQLFKSERVLHLLWAYSHGLTEDRLRLYFDDFSTIPLTLPDLSLQRSIGRVLQYSDSALARARLRADPPAGGAPPGHALDHPGLGQHAHRNAEGDLAGQRDRRTGPARRR